MLLFRPVPKDLALVADLIDPERKRDGKGYLALCKSEKRCSKEDIQSIVTDEYVKLR